MTRKATKAMVRTLTERTQAKHGWLRRVVEFEVGLVQRIEPLGSFFLLRGFFLQGLEGL